VKFQAGDRFGNLMIERRIGAGAFGTVYAARDELLRRRVALKVVRAAGGPAHTVDRERVLSEARLVGALQSPAVATLYRLHELPDAGGWALELEYIDGAALDERIDGDRALNPVEALRVFIGVIEALTAAHAAGIVHGDIKPANILMDRAERVKVVDFGVARILGDAVQDERLPGQAGGTPTYMAPEVVMGNPARPASDVWSAGVVLHRLLAGSTPFRSNTIDELLPSILNDPPLTLPGRVPAPLATIVTRCLEKNPMERPKADAAFRAELMHLIEGAAREERRRDVLGNRPSALPGRDDELTTLARCIEEARNGTARTLLIEAAPGRGVTSMLQAGAHMARAAGYRAVRTAFRAEPGILRLLAEETQRGAPDGWQRAVEIPANAQRILQGSENDPRPLLWAVERWLRVANRDAPIAVFLDDAEHASQADRRAIQEIARRLEFSSFLLIVGRQVREAGEAPFFATDARHRRIELGPLAPEAIDTLLTLLGDGSPSDTELVSQIVRSTEGNPLFASELFSHLRSTGEIELREGCWRPAPDSRLTIPERLDHLVTHRLAALAPDLREVLDVAAVDGRDFDAAAIVAVLERPLLSVLRALQRLYRDHDFIAPTETGYRFRHELARDAICRAIDPAHRTEFHRRLAAHLESRPDGVSAERIGVHWELAGAREEAAPHLRKAMSDAAHEQDPYRALALAERAGLLDDPCDPVVLEDELTWRTLTDLLGAAARIDDLQRIYATILERTRATGNANALFNVLVQRVRKLQFVDCQAELHLDEMRAMIEDQPEDRTAAWGHVVLGCAAKTEADSALAVEHLSRALEISRSLEGAEPFVSAATQLGGALEQLGRHAEAEALYRESAERCNEDDPRGKGVMHRINMAMCSFRQGVVEGAAGTIRTAISSIAVEQAPTTHAHTGLILAGVLYADGETAAAHDQARVSFARARELAFRPAITEGGAHAAAIAIALGKLDEAGEVLELALSVAERAQERTTLPLLHAIHAQHHWLAGDVAEAQAATLALTEAIARCPQPDPVLAVLPWAAESVVYGMPLDALDAAQARIESIAPEALTGRADLIAMANGARALRDPNGSIADLRFAAESLRRPAYGERLALLRALGSWFAAEAAHRGGILDAAAAAKADARTRARRLGHVWLEADLDRH